MLGAQHSERSSLSDRRVRRRWRRHRAARRFQAQPEEAAVPTRPWAKILSQRPSGESRSSQDSGARGATLRAAPPGFALWARPRLSPIPRCGGPQSDSRACSDAYGSR
eukprot:2488259-Alexandrium_andersonii.AAC.1